MAIVSSSSPSFSTLFNKFMEQTVPNEALGITHSGNWPEGAECAVKYRDRDKQFPQVEHGWCVEYFNSNEAFQTWKLESAEWIRGTDHDFSREYSLYIWDLGPSLFLTAQI